MLIFHTSSYSGVKCSPAIGFSTINSISSPIASATSMTARQGGLGGKKYNCILGFKWYNLLFSDVYVNRVICNAFTRYHTYYFFVNSKLMSKVFVS